MFLIGVAALAGVCSAAVQRHDRRHHDYRERLEMIRDALATRNAAMAPLVPMAEELVEQASYYPAHAAEAHFVLGSVLLRQAQTSPPDQADALRRRALEQLQQAESLGVPASDRPQLWFRLGQALYVTKGNLRHACDYLSRGLPQGAENPVEGYGLLAKANLELTPPELEAALRANEQQLQMTTDEAILLPARLLRADLLVRLKQYDDALQVLDRIGPAAPEAIRRKALYLKAVACVYEGQWSKAAVLWQELLQAPDVVPDGQREILYTLGNCYRHASPPATAKAIQAWQKAQQAGGAYGQAAAIRLAEVYLATPGAPQFATAAQCLQQATVGLSPAQPFANPLVKLDDLRELVESAIHLAHDHDAFGEAQQFTEVYQKISPPGTVDEKLAESSVIWAKELEAKASHVSATDATILKQQARDQWARAAQAYEQAIAFKKGSDQAACLWKSIECWRSAAVEDQVIDLLKKYLTLVPPVSDDEQARAWFMLGEAFQGLATRAEDDGKANLATERRSQAENAYRKCWEFAASPYSCRARYQLAVEQIALKKYDEAEAILWQNIKGKGATLDREANEKSLYLVSGLLYQRGKASQALFWLGEALKRYPDNADAFAARDLLGDCYLQMAKEAQKSLDEGKGGAGFPATALAQLKKTRADWLDKSVQTYDQLVEELNALRGQKLLTGPQEKLLHKAAFARADIELYHLESYPDALRHYHELATLCKGQIEELIAAQRIWTCCLALKYQPQELDQALKIMATTLPSVKLTLPQVPDEFFQGNTKTWTRQDWQNFVAHVETNLKQNSTNVLKTPIP